MDLRDARVQALRLLLWIDGMPNLSACFTDRSHSWAKEQAAKPPPNPCGEVFSLVGELHPHSKIQHK